jgi:hypothetical protein
LRLLHCRIAYLETRNSNIPPTNDGGRRSILAKGDGEYKFLFKLFSKKRIQQQLDDLSKPVVARAPFYVLEDFVRALLNDVPEECVNFNTRRTSSGR